MMAAKGAIVPVATVMANAKEPFDPKAYLPTVTGYYTDLQGNMLSFPFNSSTVMFYINKDAFKKAGLDPNKPPLTWKEVLAAAEKLKASGQECVYTTSWPSGCTSRTSAPGTTCRSAPSRTASTASTPQFTINSPLHVRHIAMLATWRRRVVHLRRPHQPGRRQVLQRRVRDVQRQRRRAGGDQEGGKFDWSINCLPYYDDVAGAPQNSIIGGASVWVMGGKKPEEYKGVAKFFAFLSQPEMQTDWHTAHRLRPDHARRPTSSRASPASTTRTPASRSPIKQLLNKAPTENSKGIRFGNFVQGRTVIEEDLEDVFAGKKDAQTALDDVVKHGNEILRQFEAANK